MTAAPGAGVPEPLRLHACWMRGGTSKGLFFVADDLPAVLRDSAALRDRVLLRLIGSPDPYGKQIDGLGGATSSTSKVVLVSRSTRPGCDVDYLFGAVAIDRPLIDWSGNCGNLSAAVGPFAIWRGLVAAPPQGLATVRIWQANIGRRIDARVPMHDGEVRESGSFELDGVAFPGAEVQLDFLNPAGGGGGAEGEGGRLFPTGAVCETLDVPGVGRLELTLIDAGNPTVFVAAEALGLDGTEQPRDVDGDAALLQRLEAIRAAGAVAMGLAASAQEATRARPATPKIAFVAAPAGYAAAGGKRVAAGEVDVLVRIVSMGRLHHALTGTGAVAVAAAAATPGSVVARLSRPAGGATRIGHPSGVLRVAAEMRPAGAGWDLARVSLSRSARRLMDGWVFVPGECLVDGPQDADRRA